MTKKTYPDQEIRKIISEYKLRRKNNPDNHIKYVKSLKNNFADVIRASAISVDDIGEKHIHQYRMSNARLKKFAKLLCEHEAELFNANTFDDLYTIISTVRVFGLGAGVYYDIALRIAHTKQNCLPDKIYLIAGVLKGAINLGLETKGKKFILPNEMPGIFAKSKLTCAEIADLLCCYFAEDKWSDCLEFE